MHFLIVNSFGIQAYWGGLAVKVVLSSIFPSFQHMANTLPLSANIATNELIGFVVYIIIFTPLMLVHPTKYHKLLYWAFGASVATMGGLFIWAVAANGGASVLGPAIGISASTRRFRMLQAVSSVAGAWTGSSIRCLPLSIVFSFLAHTLQTIRLDPLRQNQTGSRTQSAHNSPARNHYHSDARRLRH